ncbi:MAG: protein-L-isoaspartate O-methyltransferase [Candidatus Wildermuthbacteria bacterium RIFCSPHIGHO2_12_FULL_45_9]|uniref:Protein-L-isoaspartate O-methyltransferase n=1 Tax=Candidatus Wildermuthbacteria bacterium RIFCSPHIGHO2_02_FULL_45_25 TaxID=1802450 RepID=A0A1G2R334_9BACT|nr:MAG: protein-L-isoaspartate O-methyltransferase [Candidatus Wildermuthbacteria bacterium RIFCSPHIGHO2_01_FULL_45_20]OHA67294.1 MAG: protein-L-isoaspartate O-methyltransferase [Candidatus Wildermuthbacteria bacterium RIFCSPHIGHO2_02_FULL_45_25]OHA72331.1 MAG: protein-L-isoaspartate O-methyltransferase [Candidatus Wildermuthbacteria bacterium RIFCSPHIGHO2_12_FULL_45_9]
MEQLVKFLTEQGILKSPHIIDAFHTVDRKDFVLAEYQEQAYEDYPLPIGHSQTISQPSTVGFMLELLGPTQGEKILDMGSGSGWTTALLAQIAGDQGKVFGMEIIPELVSFGQKNLQKYHFSNAAILQATDVLGYPSQAPFDKILVSAAAKEIPQQLIDQLVIGGIMVIPIENAVWKIKKVSPKETETQKFEGFVFVPLVTK